MGGVVIANREKLDPLKEFMWEYGATLDPLTAQFILRGMKTYYIRYESQCDTASRLAEWLESHELVSRVLHPSLASHPEHDLVRKQMVGYGTILSVDLKGGDKALRQFLRHAKLFRLSGSLGSTESLAAPSLTFYGRDLSQKTLKRCCITAGTVRLSIGLESFDDLTADFEQALM